MYFSLTISVALNTCSFFLSFSLVLPVLLFFISFFCRFSSTSFWLPCFYRTPLVERYPILPFFSLFPPFFLSILFFLPFFPLFLSSPFFILYWLNKPFASGKHTIVRHKIADFPIHKATSVNSLVMLYRIRSLNTRKDRGIICLIIDGIVSYFTYLPIRRMLIIVFI